MNTRADRRARKNHDRTLIRKAALLAGAALLAVTGIAVAASSIQRDGSDAAIVDATNPCVGTTAPSHWNHLVIVWFENESAQSNGTVSGAPFANSLITGCGHVQRYTDANYKVDGTTKDGSYNSRPSYVTEATGVSPTVHGVTDDSYTAKTSKENVWHQMQVAGRDARAYTEGRASGDVCSGGGATSGSYHNSLRAVSPTIPNAWCNQHDVDLSTFDPAHLPELSMIFPKNTSNWHDNSIASGDTWLKDHLSPLLNSPQYASGDTAVVFVTDEDTPVVNALIAPSVTKGSTVANGSHFSLGRLTAEMLGLPLIGDQARAPSLLSLFGGGSPSTTTSSSSLPSTSSSTSSTSSSTSTTSLPTTTTTGPAGCVNHGGIEFTPAVYLHVVSSGCWQGGVIWGTTPWTDPWTSFHRSAGFIVRGPVTIRDTIIVNLGDGYHVESGNALFDHVHAWYMHDDAIENDRHQSITVKDSGFTSYVSYSDSGEFTNQGTGTVVLTGNTFELYPIPGVYKGPTPGTGPWFKTDAASSKVDLIGNRFIARQLPNHGTLGPPAHVGRCVGNEIVWNGSAPFPAAARAAWLAVCPDMNFTGA